MKSALTGVGSARITAGITRNVVVLGLVSLLTDVSSEMVYPLVPLFLTASLGAPIIAVGLIEGIAESLASLLKLASGWSADRWGRHKQLVFGGYGLSTMAKPLLAVASVWPIVLLARAVDRVGKGIRGAPRDALLVADIDPADRGRAFGFHRALDTAGAVVGPLLGLALLAATGRSFRLVFLLAAIPGLLGVLLILAVRDADVRVKPAADPPRLRGVWGEMSAPYRRFLLVGILFALGNSADAFLVLRARDLGLGLTEAVLAYVVFKLVATAASFPAGIVADRIGRRRVLGAGYGLFAVVYGGLALAGFVATDWVWPLFALYGLYLALTDGVGRAVIVDLAPATLRASALGLYQGAVGLMALAASLLAGTLWQVAGAWSPFALGAATALLAAAVLPTVPPHGPRAVTPPLGA
jgi:MFS family permease